MSALLHLFEQCSQNFLFFPASAKLFELSAPATSIVSRLYDPASGTLKAPQTAAGRTPLQRELSALIRREIGTPHPVPDAAEWNSFQTFSIYLAQTCNMSCSYCWSRGGSFGKPGHLMTLEDAAKVISLIVSLLEASRAERICVNFYGGEPLLNFAALEKITLELLQWEERLGECFDFTVDTNGLLLEGEKAQFLARHFSHVGVSVDGREEVHNRQRPGKSGESTWQQIASNILAFPNPEILQLRATLTRLSDCYLETFRQLTSFGVRRIQLEYCREPGFNGNPRYRNLVVPLDRQLSELREFADDYVEDISRYGSSGIPFISNVLDEVRRFRDGKRATRPCGAGRDTVAINSHGELFPCIAFVDNQHFRMEQDSLYQTLKQFEADRRIHCAGCWLRYDCAGGCYATRIDKTGKVRLPHPDYCRAMRGKAEVYLYAMSQMLKKCPWHLPGEPCAGPGTPAPEHL